MARKYGEKWLKKVNTEKVNTENIELSSPKKQQQVEERRATNEYTKVPTADLNPKQLSPNSYNLALRESTYTVIAEVSPYSFENQAHSTLGQRKSYIERDTQVSLNMNKSDKNCIDSL